MTLREASPKQPAAGAGATGGDPLEGTLLGGVYRVGRQVGAGAMGGIYEARNIRLDKRVAIKVMARELSANPASLARFHREAEITSRLGHPHIITVFDFGTSESGAPYLVMELLEGEDLARRLHRRGRLPLALAARVIRQVGSALAETHASGVIHRDLKPANVFLVKAKGDDDFAKVLDFGTSKVRAAASALTGASTLMGTPLYMAPEQAEGRVDQLDGATDQWALACIAYEMLAGRAPFVGDDVSAILYQVVHREPPPLAPLAAAPLPKEVEPVIRRALAKRQAARFPSVTAFARAFEAAAAGLPLPPETADDRPSAPALATAIGSSPTLSAGVRPTPQRISGAATAQPTQRWQRRRRLAPFAWAALATAATIAVAGAVWLGPSRWRAVPAKPAAASAEAPAAAAPATTPASSPAPAASADVPAAPPAMVPEATVAAAAAALATATESAAAAAVALVPLARAATRSATNGEPVARADRAARIATHGARSIAAAPRRTARRPAPPAASTPNPALPARPDPEAAAPATPSPAPVGPTKRRLIKQL